MKNTTIELECRCAVCDNLLEGPMRQIGDIKVRLEIPLCTLCLIRERASAYKSGYKDGKETKCV
jgi:hypothetical protein